MLHHSFRRQPLALATALVLGISQSAFASDTSSSIRGTILGPDGQPVTDAIIKITHLESGRTVEVSVTDSGTYSARGLRVGGPYEIIVDSVEFQDDILEGVSLDQGRNSGFDFSLKQIGTVEEVYVVGTMTDMGRIGSDFSSDDISNSASISRDVKDTVKRNPMAVVGTDGISLSVAGTNPRFNSFVVDGIAQNDDFGLNSNGYPTQRSPISLDAVESVSLSVSPFSVTKGGFSGGEINVTTKTGTNDITGTLFYEYVGSDTSGNGYERVWDDSTGEITNRDTELDFEETTFGGTIGFPVIQDKLFVFLSYENFDSPQTAEYGPPGSGLPNESFVSQSSWDQIQQIANDVYGIPNIGPYDASPVEKDEKLLAKVDWYINDYHRVALTYQDTTGNVTRNYSTNPYSLNASSYWYNKEELLETYSLNLYSDWNDSFSTEVKFAYKDTTSNSNPVYPLDIGAVLIEDEVNFGTEKSRQANVLNNQRFEFLFQGNYFVGDHEITFGYLHSNTDIFNLFAQYVMGEWQFDNIDDFAAGEVSSFSYQNSATGDPNDLAADFSIEGNNFYIEDNWLLNDDLEITYGVRYERLSMPTSPAFNDNFYDRYGFANNETFDGQDMVLPRFGFNYTLNENMSLSGGVGKFSGGYPNVWMSNSYSNDGISLLSLNSGWDPAWGTPDFGNVPSEADDLLVQGDGNTNSLDPNFELPYDWRYKLELDMYFDIPFIGEQTNFNISYLNIQRENDVNWVDLAREPIGVDDTGRVIYTPVDYLDPDASSNRYDLMLTNAPEDGQTEIWTFSMSQDWDSGVSLFASYTNTDVEEGNLGSSSTASSNFQYPIVTDDRNGSAMGPGAYSNEHRFTANLSYQSELLLDGYMTTFNLFYEARSGQPMSYVLGSYRMQGFGDQTWFDDSDAYTPYIPTGADDPNVAYGYGLDYDTFAAYLDAVGMSQYAGQLLPKNPTTQPWVHTLDFSFRQEFPGFVKDHRTELTLDIVNLLNLINEDWGRVEYQSFGSKTMVDSSYDPDTGIYTYSMPFGDDVLDTRNWSTYNARASVWQAKIGLRYKF